MITLTGIYQTAVGEARRARLEFKSTSTPQAAGGILYGNTRKLVFSDAEDGAWEVELYPGNYHVRIQDADQTTEFDIALTLELDGTTVSIEDVISSDTVELANAAIITGEAAIDHASGALPVVTVNISAHHLTTTPAAIAARVVIPDANANVFECVLVAGWTATNFSVRLLGLPEIAGYKIAYTIIP